MYILEYESKTNTAIPCTAHTLNGTLPNLVTVHLNVYLALYIYSRYFITINSDIARGSPHTSQISHLLLYPSLWLLVPGLSSHSSCNCFFNNLLVISAVVGNDIIVEKRLKDFCKHQEPLVTNKFWTKFCLNGISFIF